MPQQAYEVHGLSIEFLSTKPRFHERADDMLGFIEGAMLVMHNAAFDFAFLNAELERLSRPLLRWDRVVDTLALARRRHPGAPCSLDALCKRYGVDLSERGKHSALLDCRLLASVYVELVGGHQARLEFAANGGRGALLTTITSGARMRPIALAPRLTDEERLAHEAFVASLGEEALWRGCSRLSGERSLRANSPPGPAARRRGSARRACRNRWDRASAAESRRPASHRRAPGAQRGTELPGNR